MSGVASFFKKAFSALGKAFGFSGNNWIFAVLTLLSMFTKKKKQVQQTTTESVKESPTYSWDSVQTTSAADAPIPLIFGRHPVGGNIVNTYIETKLTKQNNGVVLANISMTTQETADTTAKIFNKVYTFNSATHTSLKFPIVYTFDYTKYQQLRQQGRNISNQWIGTGVRYVESPASMINYYFKKVTDADYIRVYPKSMTIKAPSQTAGPTIATATEVISRAATTYIDQTVDGLDLPVTAGTDYQIKIEYVYNTAYFAAAPGMQRNYIPIDMPYSAIGLPSVVTPSFTIGTGELSAQTLKTDVALGAGQIKGVTKLYVNDQLSTTYNSDNPTTGGKTVRILPEYRFGNELLPETNRQDTLQMQSSPFTVNQSINRTVFARLIEIGGAGNNYLMVDNNAVFSVNQLMRGNGWAFTVTGIEGANKVYVSPAVPATVAVDTYFYVDSNPQTDIYFKAADSYGYYTDFTYVTQQDYVDMLDLGLNAPNGLFTFNQTTGGNDNATLEFTVYIAHDEDLGGIYTLDKFKEKAFYTNPVKVTSNKKQKIWLNVIANDLPISATGNKKYAIKIRRLTNDPYDNNTQSALQIAYVEEVKQKDIFYNDIAYCALSIPADSRLNGGNPKFRFIVDGLRVPVPIPADIIDGINSTTTKIITNDWLYKHINGALTINTAYDTYEIAELATLEANITNLNEAQIIVMHCMCAGKWYKRYGIHSVNTNTGMAEFQILTPDYINTLAGSTQYYSADTKTFSIINLLKAYVATNNSIIMENTALPAVPTDMFIELFSKSPAAGSLYMLTNKANALGKPFDEIDTDSFREAFLHFREYIENPLKPGTFIRRCELNFVIDTSASVRTHLDKIMNTCHASLYNVDGKIKIFLDRKQTIPVCHIDEDEDILPDSFKVTTLDEKDLPNQIIITYLNEAADYKKDPMVIEDTALLTASGYEDIRTLEMDMFGTTCAGQVFAEGLRLVKTARYSRFVIAFGTALKALKLAINDMFTLTSTTYGWNEKKFRVMNSKKNSKQECEVEAVEYFDETYDITADDLLNYKEPKHTELPNYNKLPEPIENLTLSEQDVRLSSGDIQINLTGAFDVATTTRKKAKTENAFAVTAETAAGATAIPVKIIAIGSTVKTGDVIIVDGLNYVVASIDTIDEEAETFNINVDGTLIDGIAAGAQVSIEKLAPAQSEYDKFGYALIDLYKKKFDRLGIYTPSASLSGTVTNRTYGMVEDGTYVYELAGDTSGYKLVKYDLNLNEVASVNLAYTKTFTAMEPSLLLIQNKLVVCGLNNGTYLIYNLDLTSNSVKTPINLPATISVGLTISTSTLKFVGMAGSGDILYCQAVSTADTRPMSYIIPIYCPDITGVMDFTTRAPLYRAYANAIFGINGKYARITTDPTVTTTLFAVVPDNGVADEVYKNTVFMYDVRAISIVVASWPLTSLYNIFGRMLKNLVSTPYQSYRLFYNVINPGYGRNNINNTYDICVRKGYIYVAGSTIDGGNVALVKQFTVAGSLVRILNEAKNAVNSSIYGTCILPLSTLPEEAIYSTVNLDTGTKLLVRAKAVVDDVPVVAEPTYIWQKVQSNIKADGIDFVITGLEEGEYRADVKAVSCNGKIGDVYVPEVTAQSTIIALTGSKLLPSNVSNFIGVIDGHDRRRYNMTWGAVADADLSHYALHVYALNEQGVITGITKLSLDKKTTAYTYVLNASGHYTFNLRAVNKNGKLSETPAVLDLTADILPATPTIASLSSEFGNADFPLLLKLTPITDDAITGYAVEVSYNTTTQAYAFISSDTLRIRKEGLVSAIQSANGPVTVSVRAHNQYGQSSATPATSTVTIDGRPGAGTGLELYQDKLGNLSLRFEKPSNSQDILSYTVRYGESGNPTECTNIKSIVTNNFTLFKADNTLHNKTYYVHVQSVNKVGVVSSWVSASITIKTIPSAITGLTVIPKGNSLSLKWNENNEICFDRFEAYIGITPDFTPAPENKIWKGTSTQIPINQMPDGTALVSGQSYTVKLRAVSSVNESYVSAITAITQSTADTVPPALTLLSTTPGIAQYGVINSNSLVVTVSASDNIGIQAVKGRVYVIGATVPELVDFVLDGGVYSKGFTGLSNNSYQLEVRAIDTAGNATPLYRVFDVDTAKATTPTSVTVSQQTGNVVVSVSAELPKYFSEYEYYYATSEDNVNWSAYALLSKSRSSYINADLPISAYTKYGVKVTKVHSATLTSDMKESDAIYVDKIAPTIKITSTPNIFEKFTLLPSDTITFNFECYDEGGMNTGSGLKFYLDGIESAVTLSSTDGKNYTGSLTYNNLANAVHTISAKAVDNYYNSRESQSYTFESDIEVPIVINNVKLAVTVAQRNVTLRCSQVTTNIKNFKEFVFYYSLDGGTTKTTITPIGINPLTWTSTADRSQICFAVVARKSNGIIGTELSWTDNIKIDTTAPVISAFSISGISNGYINKAVIDAGTVNLSYAATDENSGIASVSYTKDNGVTWTALTSSPKNIISELSTDGVYNYQLKAIDNSGNIAYSDVITFTVDATAPTAVDGMSGVIRLNNIIQFNASASTDIYAYEIKAGGTNWSDATVITKLVTNQSGIIVHKWTATSGTQLVVRVKCVDKAGNYSTETTATINSTTPAIVTGLSGNSTFNGVNFWWDAVTTDSNNIVTDDITGYLYDAYIDSVAVGNKIASAITTTANNATVFIPDNKKDGKTHNIIIVLKAVNKWNNQSSGVNLSKPILRIETVDMGNNPMQYDVMSVIGGTTVKNTEDLNKLIDGSDGVFEVTKDKCVLLLDDLVDKVNGTVPIGYTTATKTADGRFVSGSDLSVTLKQFEGDCGKFGSGIAVEESRTNLWLNSKTADAELIGLSSELLSETINGANIRRFTLLTGGTYLAYKTFTLTAGTKYTLSGFIKSVTCDGRMTLACQRVSDWSYYELASVSVYTNWVRITAVFTAPTDGDYRFSFASYSSTGCKYDLALPQFEVGSFATSAILTEGTAVTRPAGRCKITRSIIPTVGSISFWGKIWKLNDSTFQHFFDTNSTNNGMSVCINPAQNIIIAALGAYDWINIDTYNNNLNHFCVTFDYTNNIYKAYYNGIYKGQITGKTLVPEAFNDLLFGTGYYNFGGLQPYCYKANVNIMNFCLFNYTLVQDEVTQIYNAGVDGDKIILKQ